ncbi:hypothetical protein [Achromobacter xylosoxidans]|uniref:hypothetical protein n=1 Tax=Alcaligenes xylosoxydans xylosoxydans TaxID=85698 RepID=UPI001EEBB315|nr:hypothetical protein [Achromobacter xylosoxidans]
MTNSYDVAHGLSQDAPGPLEPVEVAACLTCNDRGAVGNILTAQPCPDCAAPGVSTVEDAPAAGDTLALLDHPLLRDVLGYVEDAGPADVWGAAQSWMSLRDVALAAQRKGGA